jgi:hypothetical protein
MSEPLALTWLSFDGGWLMCYTTNSAIHISREVSSAVPFGSNGYRSDCRNYPFNQVMFVRHSDNDKAVFIFNGFANVVASRGGYAGRLNASWAVATAAAKYSWRPAGSAKRLNPVPPPSTAAHELGLRRQPPPIWDGGVLRGG